MRANFIESNPGPVKAVLAMMGKIQEVYRLPIVPMRRDSRSKLQKVAMEAGLLPEKAARPSQPMNFFVYENWQAGPHKIVVHRSNCNQCNQGHGLPGAQAGNHSRWHGPFATVQEAREASRAIPSVLIRSECKCI